MGLAIVTQANLIPLLEELSDPNADRCRATGLVIDEAFKCRNSPFVNGPTIEEDVLLSPCVRLGIATRIIEIAAGAEPRDIARVGFDWEIGVATNWWRISGDIPEEALRTESVFWEQIIPGYVAFGYSHTTAEN